MASTEDVRDDLVDLLAPPPPTPALRLPLLALIFVGVLAVVVVRTSDTSAPIASPSTVHVDADNRIATFEWYLDPREPPTVQARSLHDAVRVLDATTSRAPGAPAMLTVQVQVDCALLWPMQTPQVRVTFHPGTGDTGRRDLPLWQLQGLGLCR